MFDVFGIPVTIDPWTLIVYVIIALDAGIYVYKCWNREKKWAYIFVGAGLSLFTLLSVALHEIAHGLVTVWCGGTITQAGFTWWGAYVQTGQNLTDVNPWVEIAIAFAGPAMNFILAGIAAYFVWLYGESLWENSVQYFSYINIRLGRLNLLPIIALDGGKVLDGIVRMVWPGEEHLYFVLIVGSLITAYYLMRDKIHGHKFTNWEDKLIHL